MKRSAIPRLLIPCLFALFSAAAQAAEPLLYYILDGSGSMWGRVDKQTKIEVAKDTLGQLITQMPDTVHAGLTVYGHRRKGDCKDIEELVPAGPVDKGQVKQAIAGISPKGKTPIAATIEQVANRLKTREGDTTITLISDGIETCGADPCQVTRALKNSGAKFVMHVVGFDVGRKATEQLQCIAEAGGGRYFAAGNTRERLKALQTVKTAVVARKELPPAPPAPAPIQQQAAGGSKSIRIKASGPGRIKLQTADWVEKPYYWKLVDAETGKEKSRFRGLETQLVPEGEYQLVWRQKEHSASEVTLSEVVRIESGKTAEVPLLTGIRPNVPQWVKRPYYWGLAETGAKRPLAKFSDTAPQLVPAGTYDFIWRQVEHGAQQTMLTQVTVERDKLNDVTLATAINLARADWVRESTYYWGLRVPGKRRWVAKFGGKLAPQLVPPGRYDLIYRDREHGGSEVNLGEVEIAADKMNDIPLNTGVKFIPAPDMKPPYRARFMKLGPDGKPVGQVQIGGHFGPVVLTPGRWRIDYHQVEHGSKMITIVDSFELPAGALVEIEL